MTIRKVARVEDDRLEADVHSVCSGIDANDGHEEDYFEDPWLG
jgi:hypothetical protein